jgi:hypothetical protein
MSGNLRSREKDCIVALTKFLRSTKHPDIRELERIDGHQKGDALPEARAAPYLIEHFSIDSTPEQRKLGAQFVRVIDDIEQMFASISFSLIIGVPEDVARNGRAWRSQRLEMIKWIREVSPTLLDGHCSNLQIPGFREGLHV